MPSKLDEFLDHASPEQKAAIEQSSNLAKKEGIKAEEVGNTAIGKDNVNVAGGYEQTEPPNEISEETGTEAKKAAAGVKDCLSNYPTREPQEQAAGQEQEIEPEER